MVVQVCFVCEETRARRGGWKLKVGGASDFGIHHRWPDGCLDRAAKCDFVGREKASRTGFEARRWERMHPADSARIAHQQDCLQPWTLGHSNERFQASEQACRSATPWCSVSVSHWGAGPDSHMPQNNVATEEATPSKATQWQAKQLWTAASGFLDRSAGAESVGGWVEGKLPPRRVASCHLAGGKQEARAVACSLALGWANSKAIWCWQRRATREKRWCVRV